MKLVSEFIIFDNTALPFEEKVDHIQYVFAVLCEIETLRLKDMPNLERNDMQEDQTDVRLIVLDQLHYVR